MTLLIQLNSWGLPVQSQFKFMLKCVVIILILLHPGRFSSYHYNVVTSDKILENLQHRSAQFNDKNICELNISILANYQHSWDNEPVNYEAGLFAAAREIEPGGKWQPKNCASKYESVIIVPFRDREENLKDFLRLIHPFIQSQNVAYSVWVIEQSPQKAFNRAKLLNIGKK